MTAQEVAENLINGNISDARANMPLVDSLNVCSALIQRNHSIRKARLEIAFLKTGEGWQAACDAK